MKKAYDDKKMYVRANRRIKMPKDYTVQTFCPLDPIKKAEEDEDSTSVNEDSLVIKDAGP